MKRTIFEIVLLFLIIILFCICIILGLSVNNTKLQNKLDVKFDYGKYQKEILKDIEIVEKYKLLNNNIDNEKIFKKNFKIENYFFKKNFFGKKNTPIFINKIPDDLNYKNKEILKIQLKYLQYIERLINQIIHKSNYIIQTTDG